MNIRIIVADESHKMYAEAICKMMGEAAKIRGTGIAKRKPEYIKKKILEGKAVIALLDSEVKGFCYIESWGRQEFVANSGLIVHPDYRKTGLAKKIKTRIFELSKEKFPEAKLFGITTSLAVMKINSDLGYKPVTFSELTTDETFWKGCESCTNHDILVRTDRKMCLCTGMVCDLSKVTINKKENKNQRWDGFKRFMTFRKIRIQRKAKQIPKLNDYKGLTDGE